MEALVGIILVLITVHRVELASTMCGTSMSRSIVSIALLISDTLLLYAAVSIPSRLPTLADILSLFIPTNRPSSVTRPF